MPNLSSIGSIVDETSGLLDAYDSIVHEVQSAAESQVAQTVKKNLKLNEEFEEQLAEIQKAKQMIEEKQRLAADVMQAATTLLELQKAIKSGDEEQLKAVKEPLTGILDNLGVAIDDSEIPDSMLELGPISQALMSAKTLVSMIGNTKTLWKDLSKEEKREVVMGIVMVTAGAAMLVATALNPPLGLAVVGLLCMQIGYGLYKKSVANKQKELTAKQSKDIDKIVKPTSKAILTLHKQVQKMAPDAESELKLADELTKKFGIRKT